MSQSTPAGLCAPAKTSSPEKSSRPGRLASTSPPSSRPRNASAAPRPTSAVWTIRAAPSSRASFSHSGSPRTTVAPSAMTASFIAEGATVVLGEPEWEKLARELGAARIVHTADVGRGAAEAFLGRELGGDVEASLPGRLDFSGDEVFAGAHNPAGVDWLITRLPRNDYVICAAILGDKDARSMLATLAAVGSSFVATQ